MYKLSKPQKLIYDMSKAVDGTVSLICGSLITKGSKDLSEIKKAVNEIYRLNDALRIRIIETKQGPRQTVSKYVEREIETLYFNDKEEFKKYADQYAAEYADMYGELCSIKVILLNDSYGILVKLHHIIGDAWTLSLIGSQFNSFLEGKIPETYSYIDYLKNEDIYAQSKRYMKDKDFFLQQIKNCDEVSFLSDKPLTSMISKRKTYTIDAESTNRILDYTKSQNATVFFVFMSILAIYISKIKMNNEKFYIGTAILNRSNVKEKNTMGMFVNTVPLLIELDNDKTFIENLQKIKKAVFSIFRHQRYNYGELLEDLRQEKNFSGKLYDVILSYQNAKIMGSLGEFESMWHHNGMQAESLQIHIEDRDCENILHIHYDYQIDKFTENEIMYMHKHIMNLFFDVMKNSEKKICELEILSSSEKKKLLNGFNETLAKYPRNKCVHQLFEEQVLKTPNKIAVIACDKTMTYSELNKQADKIAYSLTAKGIGVGDIVAFALPRKSYLIAVIFGILKTGAAYLPIDLDYPKNRIDYILDNSNAKSFITEENIGDLLNNERMDYPVPAVSSESTCYCIYTSGSTGNPKGVLIRHKNLVNFCSVSEKNSFQKEVVSQGRILLSTFKCCFDAFGVDYALFLLNGKTVVLAGDNDISNGEKLAYLAKRHNVDVIHSTPSVIKSLCFDNLYLKMLKQIKVLIIAAERFYPELYSYLKGITSAEIFNGYGPTEATIGVTFGKMDSEDPINIKRKNRL